MDPPATVRGFPCGRKPHNGHESRCTHPPLLFNGVATSWRRGLETDESLKFRSAPCNGTHIDSKWARPLPRMARSLRIATGGQARL